MNKRSPATKASRSVASSKTPGKQKAMTSPSPNRATERTAQAKYCVPQTLPPRASTLAIPPLLVGRDRWRDGRS